MLTDTPAVQSLLYKESSIKSRGAVRSFKLRTHNNEQVNRSANVSDFAAFVQKICYCLVQGLIYG
jgi:hypothetical protein